MFLPLSQCSRIVNKKPVPPPIVAENQKSEIKVTAKYETEVTIIKLHWPPEDIWGFAIYLAFIVPLLSSLLTPKRKKYQVSLLIVQTTFLIWLLVIIRYFVFEFEPLFGGYLLSLCATLFLTQIIFEWYKVIIKSSFWHRKQVNT